MASPSDAPKIAPALTPDEWASYPNWPERISKLQFLGAGSADALPLYFPTRHGIAAANLHGQPFGFTREDVGALRSACKYQYGLNRQEEATLYSLLHRIEALLPPEGTDGR